MIKHDCTTCMYSFYSDCYLECTQFDRINNSKPCLLYSKRYDDTPSAQDMLATAKYNIKKKLQRKLKANVKVYVNNNTLFVEIISYYKLWFKYEEDTILEKLVNGLTSDTIVETVYKKYSKAIKNSFFTEK